jgi:CheY-like chemotaxis protein
MTKKILVVEDEIALREALHDKLEKEGFEVIIANNGEEGLQKAIKEEPNLILLDIIMPKMDGFAMAQKLREMEKEEETKKGTEIPKMPIIFLTNVEQDKGMPSSQKLGIYEYLVKTDWGLDNIVKKIKDTLEQ